MNSISGYIDKNPGEAQRLVGLNYDQLKQLINQVIALRTQSELEAEFLYRLGALHNRGMNRAVLLCIVHTASLRGLEKMGNVEVNKITFVSIANANL